jgi:hypothetical protein
VVLAALTAGVTWQREGFIGNADFYHCIEQYRPWRAIRQGLLVFPHSIAIFWTCKYRGIYEMITEK